MSLGKCKDCGSDVSMMAEACPKCGRPQPKSRSSQSRAAFWVVALLVIGFILAIIPYEMDATYDSEVAASGHVDYSVEDRFASLFWPISAAGYLCIAGAIGIAARSLWALLKR